MTMRDCLDPSTKYRNFNLTTIGGSSINELLPAPPAGYRYRLVGFQISVWPGADPAISGHVRVSLRDSNSDNPWYISTTVKEGCPWWWDAGLLVRAPGETPGDAGDLEAALLSNNDDAFTSVWIAYQLAELKSGGDPGTQ